MESPVEYFYGDTLRWSFGFENPNKAAVLFVCALPLLWWCWQVSGSLRHRVGRGVALGISSASILGCSYCLCMTFSRGGLVAAGVALGYFMGYGWRYHHGRHGWRWLLNGLLIGAMIGCVLWTGLGGRSAAAASGDASVGNRAELWEGALQMAVENPLGFGGGNSGAQYVQWYQAAGRDEGYRTMVNSYLTFLVERGWPVSVCLSLSFVVFWVWTKPPLDGQLGAALRASILGFMVAGIFSTTMEDWKLWMTPISCGMALAVAAMARRSRLDGRAIGVGVVVLSVGVMIMTFLGLRKSGNDPLVREIGMLEGVRTVTGLRSKNKSLGTLRCVVDPLVLGEQPSKLMRELALKADVEIWLGEVGKAADKTMWVGQAAELLSDAPPRDLILLAPAKIKIVALKQLLTASARVDILLPEIDEDGRVGFWEDALQTASALRFNKTTLTGVGNRIDWAWEQVIAEVKCAYSAPQ